MENKETEVDKVDDGKLGQVKTKLEQAKSFDFFADIEGNFAKIIFWAVIGSCLLSLFAHLSLWFSYLNLTSQQRAFRGSPEPIFPILIQYLTYSGVIFYLYKIYQMFRRLVKKQKVDEFIKDANDFFKE